MKRKGYISEVLSAVSAVLVSVWYLVSVAGLDVHRDNEHGRTYVVAGWAGGDCEAIHPEHHCHDHGCAEGKCLSDEDCCSDDFEAVLAVGGATDAPSVPDLPAVSLPILLSGTDAPAVAPCHEPFRPHSPPPGGGDLLSRICVLRA